VVVSSDRTGPGAGEWALRECRRLGQKDASHIHDSIFVLIRRTNDQVRQPVARDVAGSQRIAEVIVLLVAAAIFLVDEKIAAAERVR